jgi:predicted  nucleic acid-binding Zn-ribbon protein
MTVAQEFESVFQEDCPECGWAAASRHTTAHDARCRRWQRACKELGYKPMPSAERREVRLEALEDFRATEDAEAKFEAGMRYLRAVYDRSVSAAIDDNRHLQHPTFAEYVRMLDISPVTDAVRDRFPYNEGHIASGYTTWEAPESRGRRRQFKYRPADGLH